MHNPQDKTPLTVNSIISRHKAVLEIAKRVGRSDETEKESANRVSHLLGYALKQGHIAAQPDGGFLLGVVVAWAREKWPGKFTDLPAMISESLHDGIVCRDFMDMVVLPPTLDKCHALIDQQHHRIGELEEALRAATNEIARLRPEAENWRALCEKNKINGGRR